MPSRLKILHVASWFPSQVHSSLGNFVQRHVEAVASLHDCEVWAPVAVNGSRGSMVKMRGQDGVERREDDALVIKRLYHEATRPNLLGVARAVAAESSTMTWKPDVVHLHVAYPAGNAAVAWAKRWSVPVVLTEHWTAYHEPKAWPWWRRRAIRDVVKGVSVVCPVTSQLGDAMQRWVGDLSVKVVPNVVDAEAFCPAEPETLAGVLVGQARRSRDGQGATRMLHVSSMNDAQKNITGLLEGLAHARTVIPKLRATFVGGESEDVGTYKNAAEDLGLGDAVTFTGPQPIQRVAEAMREHDALLLNSRMENFPCVIPEAWATGIPVVAPDVGGIGEHLPPGLSSLGFLHELGGQTDMTADDWKAALTALHGATWDAEAIRQYAVDHFGVAAVAKAYDRVYQQVLHG